MLTVDPTKPYTITGAPRVVKGKVLIGNGGAEFGVRGYVSAYDAHTGALAWRFYTVPGDPSQPFENPILATAARTWTGEWWRGGGGGTVWDSMAYDPQLDLVYIGVGNGSPWNQKLRSPGGGDNLFLSSIVALRPDTGEYVWHYQTTPGEMWDYTATQHIVLADLVIDGVQRPVLMQAPKNGFFYVLDRRNGKLLSAAPYAAVNWASGIDLATGRPVVNPDANYAATGKPWVAMPGPLGAHNWQPMSFDPGTGLVFIPSFELGFVYVPDADFSRRDLAVNLGVDLAAASLPQDPATKQQVLQSVRGHLLAWDPVRQRKVWDVEYPAAWNGGVLSTAGGLVFQGDAGGHLSAYAAATGARLWSYSTQDGVVAPPISYAVGGEQYILVEAGWGGVYPLLTGEIARKASVAGHQGRLLAFKLDGQRRLPPVEIESRPLTRPAAVRRRRNDPPRQGDLPSLLQRLPRRRRHIRRRAAGSAALRRQWFRSGLVRDRARRVARARAAWWPSGRSCPRWTRRRFAPTSSNAPPPRSRLERPCVSVPPSMTWLRAQRRGNALWATSSQRQVGGGVENHSRCDASASRFGPSLPPIAPFLFPGCDFVSI